MKSDFTAGYPLSEGHHLCRDEATAARHTLLLALAVFVLLAWAVFFLVSGGQAAAPDSGSEAAMAPLQPLTITLQEGLDGYQGTWDTWLKGDAPDENHGSDDVVKLRRGNYHILIRFDLSPLAEGAEVLSATLGLYAYDGGRQVTVEAYQVLRPWLEMEATWHRPRVGETWDGPGCTGAGMDRAATPCSVQTLDGTPRWCDLDVTGAARDWVTGAADNHGLLLAAAPGSWLDTYYFRSASWRQNSQRPKLVITYTLEGGVPTTTATSTPTHSATPTNTPTLLPGVTETPTVSPTPTTLSTSVPLRTPVPDSMYPYPEQRVGFVAFGMSGIDVARLHSRFCKLERRGPYAWERDLGFDFCTVILEDIQTYELPDPETYWAYVAQLVADNPGHLWFIGNEPENPCRFGSHSREYAKRYHKLYHFIKEHDPTAQVGIGGVVLPSEIRRDWLDAVFRAYREEYGEMMPVDVWNTHILLLSEGPGECGCPPGNTCGDLCLSGGYVPREFWCRSGGWRSPEAQANAEEFKQLIRDFRQWMDTREEARDKPLIITEMGVLAPRTQQGGAFPHEKINQFMYETFDFMMNATDPDVGYAADGHRLVQRWAWYSLVEYTTFNGSLFDRQGEITDFGLNFANYTARFLPASPITIFFQKGWTGYSENGDTTLTPGEARPNSYRLWIAPDGSQKALLKFDVSVLPSNVEVVSATLSLFPWFHQGVDDMMVNCYGVKRSWDVDAANWISATQTTRWELEGCAGPGDRDMTPASSVTVVADKTTYIWDVTDLARQWVADSGTNHGVLLEGEAARSGYWAFVSSDQTEDPPYAHHRKRPKLELVVRLLDATPTPTGSPTATATQTPSPTNTATPTTAIHTIYMPVILKGV